MLQLLGGLVVLCLVPLLAVAPAWGQTTSTTSTSTTLGSTTTSSSTSTSTTSTITPGRTADTLNCDDFDFQEDAQAEFDRDPTDPHRLDQGGVAGVACEDLPRRGTTQQTTTTRATSTTTTRPAAATTTGPAGGLPATGRDTFGPGALGAGLVLLGALSVRQARRRREDETAPWAAGPIALRDEGQPPLHPDRSPVAQ